MFQRIEFFDGLGIEAIQTEVDASRPLCESTMVAKEIDGLEGLEHVAVENRQELSELLGSELIWSKLGHTDRTDLIEATHKRNEIDPTIIRDATIINTSSGFGSASYSADCATILVADPAAGYVANIHSGWLGTSKQIVPKTIQKMTEMGANADDMHVWIGPSASVESYEFGKEQPDWAVEYGKSAGKFIGPSFHLDVLGIILVQLEKQGIKIDREDRLGIDSRCTIDQASPLFSFRNFSKGKQEFNGRHALAFAPSK